MSLPGLRRTEATDMSNEIIAVEQLVRLVHERDAEIRRVERLTAELRDRDQKLDELALYALRLGAALEKIAGNRCDNTCGCIARDALDEGRSQ